MKTLVKNRALSLMIRISLIMVVTILTVVLVVKLYGKLELNKAHDHLAKMSESALSCRPAESLGEKDAIVWLTAGAKAAVIEPQTRKKIKDYANPLKHPEFTEDQIKEAEAFLAANQPAMIVMHRAEGLKPLASPMALWDIRFDNIPDNAPYEMVLPSRLLGLEARVASKKGDLGQFISSMRLLSVWMEAFNKEQPDITSNQYSQTFGAISENLYAGILREAIREGKITSSLASEMLNSFPKEDLKRHLKDYFIAVAAHRGYPEPYNYFIDIRAGYEGWRIYDFLFADLANARAMEYFIQTAEACLKPYIQVEKTIPEGCFIPTFVGKKWFDESYRRYIGNVNATMAQRQLAFAALKAIEERGRTGQWPPASALPSGDDPCTCGRMQYEVKADGSLRLSYPGLEDLCGTKDKKNSNWMVSEEWTIPAETLDDMSKDGTITPGRIIKITL